LASPTKAPPARGANAKAVELKAEMPDYSGGKQHTPQGAGLLFISNRGEFASFFFIQKRPFFTAVPRLSPGRGFWSESFFCPLLIHRGAMQGSSKWRRSILKKT
jgi:hypothetical protein